MGPDIELPSAFPTGDRPLGRVPGCLRFMPPPRQMDVRDEVDGFVRRHQVDYSIAQLRLVGLVLLAFVLAHLLLAIGFGRFETPLARLTGLASLSQSLLLLPLGFSLYLLAGGNRRNRREQLWTYLVHQALLPLAVVCLLVLPAVTLLDAVTAADSRGKALRAQEELTASQQQLLEKMRAADTTAEVARLVRAQGIELPTAAGPSIDASVLRFELAMERQGRESRRERSLVSPSPYELEILSPLRTLTSLALQISAGLALLLLHRQGVRQMKRVGLTPVLFFRTDAAGSSPRRRAGD